MENIAPNLEIEQVAGIIIGLLFVASLVAIGVNRLRMPYTVALVIVGLVFAGGWQMFEKAGKPGWAFIVPFYNFYCLCEIAGKPGWWVLFILIPPVFFILGIIVWLEVAKNFGKGTGFALGLIFLGFIFIPILGFGDVVYQGATASEGD